MVGHFYWFSKMKIPVSSLSVLKRHVAMHSTDPSLDFHGEELS